ncbi:MAG: hypothetical protein WCA84_02135 [Ignavibacteriaceae bacterium]|jgi:hypothetical protein
MGSFDKDKFYSGFNYRKFELEKEQATETRALVNKNSSANTLDSPSFYNLRIELKKRQVLFRKRFLVSAQNKKAIHRIAL